MKKTTSTDKALDRFMNVPAEYELTKLTGTGSVPKWLSGKLVRNGPALFDLEKQNLKHWFDGYGMLHGFFIRGGEVYYQSKYIQSQEYLRATSSGTVQTVAWGTASDPCRSIFRRFMSNFSAMPNNTNVNVVKIGKKYFSTSDIATINEFDIESLDTLSSLNVGKSSVMAAHPNYTDDGRVWNMTSSFGPVARNTFVSIDDTPSIEKKLSFVTKKLFYFHSFGGNERYQVCIEQPLQLDFKELITSGPKNKSFYECFTWNGNAKNTFHIYDRLENTYLAIPSDLQFFFFHTVNSFMEGNVLHIDLCGYEDNSIVDDFYIDALTTTGIADDHKASLRRISIDMDSRTVEMKNRRINLELPAINDAYRNERYRFVYGVHSPKGNTNLAVQIAKFDNDTEEMLLWGEDGVTVGEPVYVAKPGATDEDDGVLLVLCHNQATSCAELAVLDAKTLKKVSTQRVPQSLPPALHGWFY
jgi:beta,beta-carotene 9',10'-dioxygenase